MEFVPHKKAEVSESMFEYLMGEILALDYSNSADPNASIAHRMDSLGYDVGYR